ncbi:TPA: hypothetical protein DEB02_04570 [Candidatus Beckwithbacteria bacterium]|nr:hypothetical protein [Candidatus Beckwithbacteria bacterium]
MSKRSRKNLFTKSRRSIGYISGLAAGALVAGGALFLYHTKQGKKIKKDLTDNYDEIMAHLKNVVSQPRRQAKIFQKQLEVNPPTIKSPSRPKSTPPPSPKKKFFLRSGRKLS